MNLPSRSGEAEHALGKPAPALLGDPVRHREGLLAIAIQALSDGDYTTALRYADRAHRNSPEDGALARLRARLLGLSGQPRQGLRILAALTREPPGPSLALLRAELLLAAGDQERAADVVDELLGLFAVEALAGLADLLVEIRVQSGAGYLGWVGFSADGALVGALTADEISNLAERVHSQDALIEIGATPTERRGGAGLMEFSLPLPRDGDQLLKGLRDRGPIVGAASLSWPPAWRMDGFIEATSDGARGMATLGWAPDRPTTIVITDGRGHERNIVTAAEIGPDGEPRQVFSIKFDRAWQGSGIEAHAILPNGSRFKLDRLPRPNHEPPPAPPTAWPRASPTARVSIIVPVYAGLDDTLTCLRSVLATTDPAVAELIVVYDCGPESELLAALETLRDDGRITLLVNDRNLGFPASVNRGMALRPDQDVVLLNADAEVFGSWLRRLTHTAYSSPDIATVTPFSNNGSIMAYPPSDDFVCDSAQAAAFDALFGLNDETSPIDLPTGVGFCLFIKRICLTQFGLFEEEAFGRGYGEENDFCRRLAAGGWRNVAAVNLFVRHIGGRSFGPLKARLIENNLKVLNRRHPDYTATVEQFVARDPLRAIRRQMDARLLKARRRPSVLMITLGRDGGVKRHVGDRERIILAEGLRVVELRPSEEADSGGACQLFVPGEPFRDLVYRLPAEWDGLIDILADLTIQRVEIHHILGLDPAVLDLPRRLGVPYDVIVHDYSWVCPRITLISGEDTYCGEPEISTCEQCVTQHGSLIEENISVAALRQRTVRLFEGAACVTVSCQDVATRISRYVPGLALRISPWEPDAVPRRRDRLPSTSRARVAVIGAIGAHKGFNRILECARDAEHRNLPLEFVVIGYTQDDTALFKTGRVFITGRFADDEVQELLEREACNVLFYPSVAPETWSYTLTDGLSSGLPIVALPFGAVRERLVGVRRGRLVAPESSAGAVNDALIDAAHPKPLMSLRTHGLTSILHDPRNWVFAPGESARPGESAWIEGFCFNLIDIHSSALLTSGDQTPWVCGDVWCCDSVESRPLMGLAIQLGGPATVIWRCSYRARFSSGQISEASDGAVCRSPHPNDPLIGVQLRLRARG
jgi:GT2 family glycosyltransferase